MIFNFLQELDLPAAEAACVRYDLVTGIMLRQGDFIDLKRVEFEDADVVAISRYAIYIAELVGTDKPFIGRRRAVGSKATPPCPFPGA